MENKDSIITFQSFIPRILGEEFLSQKLALFEPSIISRKSVILFLDISGFTRLSERIQQENPIHGPEILTRDLNEFFDGMILLIHNYHGDILKFAGDAVLVNFCKEESESLTDVMKRGALCGWELSQKFNNFQTKSGEILGCKLSISYGDIHILRVGGMYNRWETLITGKPIAEVGNLMKYTQMGEYSFNSKIKDYLKKEFEFIYVEKVYKAIKCNIQEIYNNLPIAPDKRIIEFAEKYIPGAILRKLQSGQGVEWLGELRKISVIFFHLDPPSRYLRISNAQELMLDMQKIIYKYEGSINKISIDEKGISLLAAFGLPPMTHENDPHRAIYASYELSKFFHEIGLPSSIGIATGKVFCGVIGNDIRREYTVMGDTVNTAARLMMLEPSSTKNKLIFCDTTTYNETQNEFIYEEKGFVQFKGKSKKIKVYKPLSSSSKARLKEEGPYIPLIGRESLKNDIRTSLYQLKLQQEISNIELIIIEGESGIGKTKLANYIEHHSHHLKLTTLYGSADSLEKFNPFYLWKNIFENIFPYTQKNYNKTIKSKLTEEEIQEFPLLKSVLQIDLDKEPKLNIRDEEKLDRTINLLTKILIRMSEKNPILIILEDLHWADQISWKFLTQFFQNKSKILIISTTRPIFHSKEFDGLNEAYKNILNKEYVKRINLENLTVEDIESIIKIKLSVDTVPAKMLNFIYEKSQGNPFFAEELSLELLNKDIVQKDNRDLVLLKASIDASAIPDTVQDVVTSRIDRLSPNEQLILKAASVVGRIFPTKILKEVIPFINEENELIKYLETLSNFDLIPIINENNERFYNFKHIITKEVAYNLMLLSQRKELHKKTGEVIEKLFKDNLSDHYQTIANHYYLGESWEKAHDFYFLTGLSSMELYAYPEARFSFTRALEAIEKCKFSMENNLKEINTLINLVSVSFVSDGPDINLLRLTKAENLATALDQSELAVIKIFASIYFWKGKSHYYAGRPKEAVMAYKQLVSMSEEINDPDLLAIPQMVLGRVSCVTGKYREGIQLLKAALPFLEKKSMWSDWIVCSGFIGWCKGSTGELEKGLKFIDNALKKSQDLKSNTGISISHICYGFYYLQNGNIEKSYEHSREAINFSKISGDKVYEYAGYGLLGYTSYFLGKREESDSALKNNLDIERELGGKLIVSEIMTFFHAEIKFLTNDLQLSEDLCNKSLHLAQASDSYFGLGLANSLKARILKKKSAPIQQIIDLIDKSIDFHDKSGSVYHKKYSEDLKKELLV